MGHYVVTAAGDMEALKNQMLRRLRIPFKVAPAGRPKDALTEGISGLWITHGKHVYRVTPPRAPNLAEACPVGQVGEVVYVKERLVLNGKGWCYAHGLAPPVTIPADDPRMTEMIAWAHHREGYSCTARQMPAFAARYHLKITAVAVQEPLGIRDGWYWVVDVKPVPAGGAA